jgi:hypothetical protein
MFNKSMVRSIALLFVVISSYTFGQMNTHFGGRSAGLAHSSVTLSDVWSSHHNQAGLAWLENSEAGVFVQNRFLLKELNYSGFAYAHKLNSGALALSFSNFGYQLYGESKIGLGYGLKFSNIISGGIQLNYHNTRLANNYGKKSGITAELGMQAYLNDKLILAAHLFNPTRTQLNDYNNERMATIMRLGLNYKFSKQVFATAEVEKDIDARPIFRAGIEYRASELIYLRGGVGTQPTLAAFGVGVSKSNFKLDIAASYHQMLGFTPDLSLNYLISKSSNQEKKVDSTFE